MPVNMYLGRNYQFLSIGNIPTANKVDHLVCIVKRHFLDIALICLSHIQIFAIFFIIYCRSPYGSFDKLTALCNLSHLHACVADLIFMNSLVLITSFRKIRVHWCLPACLIIGSSTF